jgi:hypothetical protein
MKALLLLPFLLTFVLPTQHLRMPLDAAVTQNLTVAPNGSSIEVVAFKCTKSRQVLVQPAYSETGPARAIIPQNKNYARNARVNDPVGARDPNEDTIDGRSAALEKISQEARRPPNKPVDGYAYRVKMQNTNTKAIDIVFWEYQFIDNAANSGTVTRRQFLCGVNIKPDKGKEVQAFSLSGPSEVVNVDAMANKPGSPAKEQVVINRVEYADGSIWQRKDWNFAEIGMSYRRAVATPWGPEMCRGL